ncbi:hypothetical protein GCM10020255_042120 [Rhodococcus baikonurensis]
MTLALPMLLGAVFVGFLVPRVLRAVSSALSPTVLLAAWLGSMASALYLALSAVLVLVWPSHAPVEGWSTVSLGVSAPSRTARVHGWVN